MVTKGLLSTELHAKLTAPHALETAFVALFKTLEVPSNVYLATWWIEELLLQLHEQQHHTNPKTEDSPKIFSETCHSTLTGLEAWFQEVQNDPVASRHPARVAQDLGITHTHFRRLVKHHIGVAPHHYISHCRLERAAIEIRNNDTPIKAIAARYGFADVAYFTRLFGRFHGVSPANYRHTHKYS